MIVRECVRALIEDPDGRILLMRIVEPSSGRTFWITPGGGCEETESDSSALARELYEETGLNSVPDGQFIWTRTIEFPWEGVNYKQDERYYWLKVAAYDARPIALESAIEAASFAELRWWTVEEIAASNEAFAPLDLAAQITRLREHGASAEPIALET